MSEGKALGAKRFNISITENEIEKARISDSSRCVVAQAIARSIPDAMYIDVDTQTIRFSRNGERLVYLCPYAVQGYVIAFDAGEEIEPFDFQLRDPIRVRRLISTAKGLKQQREAKAEKKEAASTEVANTQSSTPKKTSVKAAYSDSKNRLSDGGGRKAPPRVFKTKRRAYGHRLLRINQETPE